jgi:hypothetical protein
MASRKYGQFYGQVRNEATGGDMKPRTPKTTTMLSRFFLPLMACFTLTIASCSLVEDALPDVTVNVNGSDISFALPQADEAGTFTLLNAGLPSDVAEKLADENIDEDRVKSVTLTSANFRIATTGATVGFSAIDRVSLTVTAPGFGTLTLSETDFTSLSGNEVLLTIAANTDLLDHLLAPTADYQLVVRPEFAVTAKPL